MYIHSDTIQLAGITFYIDFNNEQFREVNNCWNTIPFDELVFNGNSLVLFYDTINKNVFEGLAIGDRDDLQIIEIPTYLFKQISGQQVA
jgi:hypothetical protein